MRTHVRTFTLIPLLVALLGVTACGGKKAAKYDVPEPRLVSLEEVARYRNGELDALRYQIARDMIPGGLSAIMAPMFVDWAASDVENPDGHVVLLNVNHGGNPLAGETVFRKIRFELEALESCDFVIVPLMGGSEIDSPALHGQLHFVFASDRPGHVIGEVGRSGGRDDVVHDLVLSWEAWRPPGADFDVISGMDPSNFKLTLRAYSGPQRFLEDALANRDWFAHPLAMPGGKEGLLELFMVALVMGDGMSRRTINESIAGAGDEWWMQPGRDVVPGARSLWDEWNEKVADYEIHEREQLGTKEDITYQTFLRSCATMSLHAISVTVARLKERGAPGSEDITVPPDPALDDMPDWMLKLGQSGFGGILLRSPQAIGYMISHPESLPNNMPKILKEAGLLQLDEKGRPVVHQYSLNGMTPYGPASVFLLK